MKRLTWLVFAFGVVAFSPAAQAQTVTVVVNGQPMSFSQPPIVRAGRVFVPLRGIFERLGATVVYSNGQINATAHGRAISLTIGSTQATVGGQPAALDVAPFIVGATTFVPLRFISQALGASVNWNDNTSTVTIRSTGPVPVAPPVAPVPRPRGIYLVLQSPTGTISDVSPTIRFRFDRPVIFERLRLWVDGTPVTNTLRQNGAAFAVDLLRRLARGPHRVRVAGVTASGVPFDLSWTFIRG